MKVFSYSLQWGTGRLNTPSFGFVCLSKSVSLPFVILCTGPFMLPITFGANNVHRHYAFFYFIFKTILWDRHFYTYFTSEETCSEKFNYLLNVTHLGRWDWPQNTFLPDSGANTLSHTLLGLPTANCSHRYDMGFWKSTDFLILLNHFIYHSQSPKSGTSIIYQPWAHNF